MALTGATLVAGGCGGASLGPSTVALVDGTEVSPRRYLADVDAAATAIRSFSDWLEQIGPVARVPRLRSLAPEMAVPLQQTNQAVGRLRAQRLADARLEAQRQRAVPVLEDILRAMTAATTTAAAGDADGTAEAVTAFGDGVERLRELPVGE